MSKEIVIGTHSISIKETDNGDFLCLTDLAKLVNEDTSRVISKWIELLSTLDFLNTWEKDNNPDYNTEGYLSLRVKAGVPNFYLSVSKWIKTTNAKGIISKPGRYGGTYAHHLIALEFCSAMDAEFRYKVFKEYTSMKQNQAEKWLKTHQFFLKKIEDNTLANNQFVKAILEGKGEEE